MQKKDVNNSLNIGAVKGEKEICPYNNKRCIKISKTEKGICSFCFKGEDQIICPNYFKESDFIRKAANICFDHSNYRIIKELKYLNNFFDYVVVNADNSKEFFVIELQSLDTCGSYKFLFNESKKPFTINWKTTEKNLISQIIEKTSILKKYGARIVVVLQNTLFDYLNLCETSGEKEEVIFLIYKNELEGLRYTKKCTVSLSNIVSRFQDEKDGGLISIINKKLNRIDK